VKDPKAGHHAMDTHTETKAIIGNQNFDILRDCSCHMHYTQIKQLLRGYEHSVIHADWTGDFKEYCLNYLVKSQFAVCWYCGGEYHCMDHVVPQKRGGDNSPFNLVPSCGRCNLIKRDYCSACAREKLTLPLAHRVGKEQREFFRSIGVDLSKYDELIQSVTFYGEVWLREVVN